MALNWKTLDSAYSNEQYVAPWGNDILGDGSRENPWKTPPSGNINLIIAPGVYYDHSFSLLRKNTVMIGDGGVVTFDGRFQNFFFAGGTQGSAAYKNIHIKNYNIFTSSGSTNTSIFERCFIEKISSDISSAGNGLQFVHSVLKGVTVNISTSTYPKLNYNSTWIDSTVIFKTTGVQGFSEHNIYSNCDIEVEYLINFENTLFDSSCAFWFQGGGMGSDETTFTAPTGATPADRLQNLRARCVTVYGGVEADYFKNCVVDDPQFNNSAIGDYTLRPTSPARNLGFLGSYVGAFDVGYQWRFHSVESESSWLNSEGTNVNVQDDLLQFSDYDLIATIEGKPKDFSQETELSFLPVISAMSWRNGENLGASDLATSTIAAGTGVLTTDTFYRVETGAITHNASVLNEGDTFKAVNGDFTTTAGGVVREITKTPLRPSIAWRFSNGNGDSLGSGDTLIVDSWYQATGDVTYNSVARSAGEIFKCVSGTTSFTGSGTVETIFSSSDSFHDYAIGIKPMSNNVGNMSSGAISAGNGDNGFDFDNEFAIVCRYAQPKLTMQPDNLSYA